MKPYSLKTDSVAILQVVAPFSKIGMRRKIGTNRALTRWFLPIPEIVSLPQELVSTGLMIIQSVLANVPTRMIRHRLDGARMLTVVVAY